METFKKNLKILDSCHDALSDELDALLDQDEITFKAFFRLKNLLSDNYSKSLKVA
ncbi:MAG: hypothetical protein GY821_02000 [Gammaproteobacteria bacterium]|nr:hypothetical protein [Gammaproteobacteria bacterium]